MKLSILFGGSSFEHEISIVSAITLKSKLEGFELEFIFCDTNHQFYYIDSQNMKSTYFSSKKYKNDNELFLKIGYFELKKMFSSTKIDSTVLNLVHGGDGEDGTISSLLDFYKIKYIGPRTEASVFSFDKIFTKYLANSIGVKTLKYQTLNKKDKRVLEIDLPVILKPSRLGSSIGVSIVKDESELDYALDVAFEFDENVLIEPFINGVKEFNLAGYKTDKINFSIVEEPQKTEFLDFEKKYMDFSRDGSASEAVISEALKQAMRDNFTKIYGEIFNGALIRCDFFVIDGAVYLNEINPIPGSMANYLFEDFSNSIKELVETLELKNEIKSDYSYINSITMAKGK